VARLRFGRVLLVSPFAPGRFFGGVRPPVGLAYVEQTLAAAGVHTDALDMNLGADLPGLLRRVRQFGPDLIGLTLMTYQYRHSYGLAARLKEAFPDAALVAGGPHVCALGSEVLRECPALDYGVVGEGERPTLQLCQGTPEASVPGLLYRDGGEVRSGPPAQPVEDLDSLPYPRFGSYPLRRYTPELEIVTSRGCPHDCIFCAVSSVMGRRIRRRSVESVVDELRYHRARGVRRFSIGDDNFLASRERVLRLSEAVRRAGLRDLMLRCGQGVRADRVDGEVLAALRNMGVRHLGVGVESASDRVLRTIRKGCSAAAIEAGVARCCAEGFDVTLLFVVGTPGETSADVGRSVDLALRHPVMKAYFFNLVPFPGTPLYRWVADRDAFVAPYEQLINRADELKLRSRPFFATPEFSLHERLQALQETERVSKRIQVEALRRKLAGLGPLAPLAAQLGRYDLFERAFVQHPWLRRVADRVLFGFGSAARV